MSKHFCNILLAGFVFFLSVIIHFMNRDRIALERIMLAEINQLKTEIYEGDPQNVHLVKGLNSLGYKNDVTEKELRYVQTHLFALSRRSSKLSLLRVPIDQGELFDFTTVNCEDSPGFKSKIENASELSVGFVEPGCRAARVLFAGIDVWNSFPEKARIIAGRLVLNLKQTDEIQNFRIILEHQIRLVSLLKSLNQPEIVAKFLDVWLKDPLIQFQLEPPFLKEYESLEERFKLDFTAAEGGIPGGGAAGGNPVILYFNEMGLEYLNLPQVMKNGFIFYLKLENEGLGDGSGTFYSMESEDSGVRPYFEFLIQTDPAEASRD